MVGLSLKTWSCAGSVSAIVGGTTSLLGVGLGSGFGFGSGLGFGFTVPGATARSPWAMKLDRADMLAPLKTLILAGPKMVGPVTMSLTPSPLMSPVAT